MEDADKSPKTVYINAVVLYLLGNGVFHFLLDGPGDVLQGGNVARVAPVAHGGAQKDGGEMVAADEGAFDPGEEENDDLPAAILSDELKEVLELDRGGVAVAIICRHDLNHEHHRH